FSLFMAVADVALKANELAAAQDALVKELTSPVNIAKSVAEYKKIKEAVGKAKLEFDQALEKLEKIKVFNDFLKAFVEHVKEIKEKNKLPIENELILLEGALEATDKIINANISYVKAFNTTPQKHKSLVKELLSALGDTVGEGIIETDAKLLAEAIYNKDYKIEHSTKFYEGMSQYAVKVLQTSDVIAALNPVKGDDVDALKVIDAITHNEFFQEIFSTVIQKAASSAAKAMFKGGFRKKAAQFNVASKAASLTWGIGTKLLPMMWDSCTTSKKLSIGIVNGKISQYQAPKVDLWIEDLTTGKPVYWYNNMGESLSASGDTLTAIQGRKYRIHLKSKQAGILDYSLDNNKSDAVHKSWIRTPVKVNGLFIRRTTVENENQILAHKQLCARRALQDGNTMVYGLNQFTTLSGFACVEGQVGTGDAQLFSPP
ncbi:MAG TPA: hypothetical protein PKC11_14640, partial [Agitococcus sp.]|nr:hypothetical protein [Agitococcus sp.]